MMGEVTEVPWHKVEQSLPGHRKTFKLAANLGIPPLFAMGHIIALWLWADDNVPLSGLLPDEVMLIEHSAGWTKKPGKFLEAVVDAGFVDHLGDRYYLHDWEERAGAMIRERERNRLKSQSYRDKQMAMDGDVTGTQPGTSPDGTGHVTETVTDTNTNSTYLEKNREEKKREEKTGGARASAYTTTAADQEWLTLLWNTPGYRKDTKRDIDLLVKLRTDFSTVDLCAETRHWQARLLDKPLGKGSVPRQALYNWCRKAEEFRARDRQGSKRDDNFGLDSYPVPVMPEEMYEKTERETT